MSKDKVSASGKKELRKEVTRQLESSLGTLQGLLGAKKFDARIKKAVKILTEGVATVEKKATVKTKTAKTKPAETIAPTKAVAEPAVSQPAETSKAVKPAKAPKAVAAPKAAIKKPAKATPATKK